VEGNRDVTRREFDEVIRRATELAASDSDAGEGALAEGELLRIAGEVGLSERHVRRALAEVRSGAPRSEGGTLDRLFGPEVVRAGRIVEGAPPSIVQRLDAFLVGGRLLQAVRRSDRILQYRPAVDWASRIARAASATSRRYYIAAARSVEVRLEPVDGRRTLVEIDVDPGSRGESVGGSAAGVFVGAIVGIGVSVALAPSAPPAVGVGTGTAVAVGLGAGATAWARSLHHRKLRDVSAEVEGVLDALEAGDALEPPPASWRRWVQRHFHGVAKDILVTKDE